jgi:hypothetical protein
MAKRTLSWNNSMHKQKKLIIKSNNNETIKKYFSIKQTIYKYEKKEALFIVYKHGLNIKPFCF